MVVPAGYLRFVQKYQLCETTEQRETLILNELGKLRSKMDRQKDTYSLRKCIWKLLLIKSLGHDIDFVHSYAIKLLSKKKDSYKSLGSLALEHLFNAELDVLTLSTQILFTFCKSSAPSKPVSSNDSGDPVNSLAVVATIGNKDYIPIFLPHLTSVIFSEVSTNSYYLKALSVFIKMYRLKPEVIKSTVGKLETQEVKSLLKRLDEDNPVLLRHIITVLEILLETENEEFRKKVCEKVVSVAKKLVLDHLCHPHYVYHGTLAPLLTVSILKFLQKFELKEIPLEVLRLILERIQKRSEITLDGPRSTAILAVLFESIKLIASLLKKGADPSFLAERAVDLIARYISVRDPDLRLVGLKLYCELVEIKCIKERLSKYRKIVKQLVDDNDESICREARKALFLASDEENATDTIFVLLQCLEREIHKEQIVFKKVRDMVFYIVPLLDSFCFRSKPIVNVDTLQSPLTTTYNTNSDNSEVEIYFTVLYKIAQLLDRAFEKRNFVEVLGIDEQNVFNIYNSYNSIYNFSGKGLSSTNRKANIEKGLELNRMKNKVKGFRNTFLNFVVEKTLQVYRKFDSTKSVKNEALEIFSNNNNNKEEEEKVSERKSEKVDFEGFVGKVLSEFEKGMEIEGFVIEIFCACLIQCISFISLEKSLFEKLFSFLENSFFELEEVNENNTETKLLILSAISKILIVSDDLQSMNKDKKEGRGKGRKKMFVDFIEKVCSTMQPSFLCNNPDFCSASVSEENFLSNYLLKEKIEEIRILVDIYGFEEVQKLFKDSALETNSSEKNLEEDFLASMINKVRGEQNELVELSNYWKYVFVGEEGEQALEELGPKRERLFTSADVADALGNRKSYTLSYDSNVMNASKLLEIMYRNSGELYAGDGLKMNYIILSEWMAEFGQVICKVAILYKYCKDKVEEKDREERKQGTVELDFSEEIFEDIQYSTNVRSKVILTDAGLRNSTQSMKDSKGNNNNNNNSNHGSEEKRFEELQQTLEKGRDSLLQLFFIKYKPFEDVPLMKFKMQSESGKKEVQIYLPLNRLHFFYTDANMTNEQILEKWNLLECHSEFSIETSFTFGFLQEQFERFFNICKPTAKSELYVIGNGKFLNEKNDILFKINFVQTAKAIKLIVIKVVSNNRKVIDIFEKGVKSLLKIKTQ